MAYFDKPEDLSKVITNQIMEDKDIERLLNPILEESMNASIDMFIESKEQLKGEKETISFIINFLGDSLEYYTSTNNIEKIRLICDLKQEFTNII